MDLEELVRLVVAQVLQSLKEKEEEKKYKALVLFTGGKTKYREALGEIKKLEKKGWSFIFACSKDAAAMFGPELRHEFPGVEFLTSPLNASPLAIQEEMDLILVPTLSQNSLVKVALGLGDTLPTLLIRMALLLGKPILAAKNAADARYFCQQRGLTQPSVGLLKVMDEHLTKLESLGIRLVEAQDLSKTAEKMVENEKKEPVLYCGQQVEIQTTKKVITGEEILAAAQKGENIICQPGRLITPLARELADKHGVKLLDV